MHAPEFFLSDPMLCLWAIEMAVDAEWDCPLIGWPFAFAGLALAMRQ